MIKDFQQAFVECKFHQMPKTELRREFGQLLTVGLTLLQVSGFHRSSVFTKYYFGRKHNRLPSDIQDWMDRKYVPEYGVCVQVLLKLQSDILEECFSP